MTMLTKWLLELFQSFDPFSDLGDEYDVDSELWDAIVACHKAGVVIPDCLADAYVDSIRAKRDQRD